MVKTLNILVIDESYGFGGSITCLDNLISTVKDSGLRFFVMTRDKDVLRDRLMNAERRYFFNTHPIIASKAYLSVHRYLCGKSRSLTRAFSYLFTLIEFVFVFPVFFIFTFYLCSRNDIDKICCNNSIMVNMFPMVFAWMTRKRCMLFERSHMEFSKMGSFLSVLPENIVTVSKRRKDALINIGVDPGKIKIVSEPVNPAFLSDAEIEVMAKKPGILDEYNISDGDVLIGHVGRFDDWKGQDLFLYAAAKVLKESKNVRFFLVGAAETGGHERYEDKLKKMSTSLGLDEYVVFTGMRYDIERIMMSLDIVVHSSIVPEPFGSVIAEAMFLGRPVIASADAGACERLIDGYDVRMFSPGDADELAAVILELVDDTDQRERLGKNARVKAKTVFSPGKIREDIVSLTKCQGSI